VLEHNVDEECAMKVDVDWDLCDGNAVCTFEAPEVFRIDDDDNLIVLQEEPAEELRSQVQAAIRICPKRAISVEG
jgi:ferredoxin